MGRSDGASEGLIDEVRLLYNVLVKRGERLHRGEDITMGMRAVLEFLSRRGPTAVPSIARARRVSRQHVQALVNPLLERGLVVATANPAHRRSPLMRLTPRGQRTIDRMRRREAAVLGEVPLPGERLRRAAGTLRALRRGLEEQAAGRRRPRSARPRPGGPRPGARGPR